MSDKTIEELVTEVTSGNNKAVAAECLAIEAREPLGLSWAKTRDESAGDEFVMPPKFESLFQTRMSKSKSPIETIHFKAHELRGADMDDRERHKLTLQSVVKVPKGGNKTVSFRPVAVTNRRRIVDACGITALVALAASGTEHEKIEGMNALSSLTMDINGATQEETNEIREKVADAGGIAALIAPFRMSRMATALSSSELRTSALAALWHLAAGTSKVKTAIVNEKGIELLVDSLMKSKKEQRRELSAATLARLAKDADIRTQIEKAGGIAPLTRLLTNKYRQPGEKKVAAEALINLAQDEKARERIVAELVKDLTSVAIEVSETAAEAVVQRLFTLDDSDSIKTSIEAKLGQLASNKDEPQQSKSAQDALKQLGKQKRLQQEKRQRRG